jgi:hypothetical protein
MKLTPFAWAVLFCLLFWVGVGVCLASDKVMVQVVFTEDVEVNKQVIPFTDALYYSMDDYANLKPEDLAAKKKERVDNWVNILEHPVVQPEPTKEQMLAEIQSMEEQKVSLEARKAELQAKISAISIAPNEEPLEEIKP